MRTPLLLALSLATALSAQPPKTTDPLWRLSVKDLTGAAVPLASLRGPVTVVTFVSTQCPISNAYNDRMQALYKDYEGQAVHFIFVNANRTEQAAEVASHAKAVGFTFPVYKDDTGDVAGFFDAQVTPESFLVDNSGTIVYHGQIDDSKNEARITSRSLRLALDAVLAGKPVPVAEKKAFGCTIKRLRRNS